MNFFLSISDQLFCRIKLVSLWVYLNAIHTCVIITNLSWPSVFQYIITNHTSVCIVVFRNFLKPDFIGKVTESWSYMLPSLLTCEWMWHWVYPIWPCPVFSMISGWNILRVFNDISGLILDRVNEKFISISTPFLGGLY